MPKDKFNSPVMASTTLYREYKLNPSEKNYDKLIKNLVFLAEYVAKRKFYTRGHEYKKDLAAEAISHYGKMLEVAERLDENNNDFEFSPFAQRFLKRKMIDYMRKNQEHSPIKPSKNLIKITKKVDRVIETNGENLAPYVVDRMLHENGLSENDIRYYRKNEKTTPVEFFEEEMVDSHQKSIEEILLEENNRKIIRNLVDNLRPVLRDPIKLVYFSGKLQEDAAAMLGCTHSNISLSIKRAIKQLRLEYDKLKKGEIKPSDKLIKESKKLKLKEEDKYKIKVKEIGDISPLLNMFIKRRREIIVRVINGEDRNEIMNAMNITSEGGFYSLKSNALISIKDKLNDPSAPDEIKAMARSVINIIEYKKTRRNNQLFKLGGLSGEYKSVFIEKASKQEKKIIAAFFNKASKDETLFDNKTMAAELNMSKENYETCKSRLLAKLENL